MLKPIKMKRSVDIMSSCHINKKYDNDERCVNQFHNKATMSYYNTNSS